MLSRKRSFSEYSAALSDGQSVKKVRFNPMVGIPRSKGCRVCVQRRVKCDQTRPFCIRCIKGNRECPGYEPSIKFQDEGPKLRELYRHDTSEQMSGQTSTHTSSEDPQFEYSTEVPLTLRLTHVTNSGLSEPGDEELSIPVSFETTLSVAIMSPTLNQAQLLSTFIGTLSANKSPTLKPTFRYTALFLAEVADHTGQSPVLEWAVRAVSLSHLGRQVEDQHLIQMSRQMYRQALLTLNAALQDPIDGLSAKTLAATILLSFYEVINCTEKDAWVRHAGGAGHLMRLRGPERHRAGLGRVCFLTYRHSLVIEALLSGTATFLAVKPWLDLSRDIRKGMPDRTAVSDLVDDFHLLIVEFPGFIQSVKDSNTIITTRRKLLATGQAHRANLKVLYKRVMATLEETGQSIIEQPSATSDPIFSTVYQFPTLTIGSLLCGYWSTLTVLNHNLALLENEITPPSHPGELSTANARTAPTRYHLRNSPSDGGTYVEENLSSARASCKAAEALSTSAFLGPLYLIFALRVAYNTFASGREKDWVLHRLEAVSAHLGLARALLDVQDERARQQDESRRGSAVASASASATASASASPELVSRKPSVQQRHIGDSREGGERGSGVRFESVDE